jgi:uncharacterized protein (UPF0303 family)
MFGYTDYFIHGGQYLIEIEADCTKHLGMVMVSEFDTHW